ncbi:MAG TPA: hypothetical protein VGH28_10050 [Polyangiaceae bacterium]|jgi:hypothetical protein
MNEPEELPLSDLIEDDFEAMATRVLPKAQMASYPPIAMTASVHPPKKSDAPIWAAVVGATFIFALAAVGAALFLFVQHRHADETADTTNATAATAEATDTAAPAPVPTVTATASPTEKLEPLAVSPRATVPVTTVHAAPAPHGSGVLQTFAVGHGKTIWVDGRAAGIGGAHVKTSCGRHSIAVGTSKARTYEVPCNGSAITVGSADGS